MAKECYVKPETDMIELELQMPLAVSFTPPTMGDDEEDADGAAAKTDNPSFSIWDED